MEFLDEFSGIEEAKGGSNPVSDMKRRGPDVGQVWGAERGRSEDACGLHPFPRATSLHNWKFITFLPKRVDRLILQRQTFFLVCRSCLVRI